jgi:hypothetical protein
MNKIENKIPQKILKKYFITDADEIAIENPYLA